ncbi:serine/threonine-protein kinase 16-like isoform X1 [Mercenaria mercenaria]|uniref:serine/threonine-protein kinase 16-like isoform X1 n=1 Tax=Mercenaria mercenaria TaxID=6596 RepID=UPI00234F0823|nr:serine/threonine-protein kinase 16-like isoform X1 [Mercenaria mercenaria]XP_045169586.2 serine/threonine-protein kinase 16-like isoform X1 [Mercenaria mercenaria]XP_045169588.2 serine/threonine-protein kinase 16-like isoform X1 [Mercenaria mercenaria]
MNTVGLATLLRMGCICGKESLTINNRRFYIRSRLGEGGFSVVDLLEDARNHNLYAMKRITCHDKNDERVAMREVEIMKSFKNKNLVPLVEYSMITVGQHVQSHEPITEVLVVMPFYRRGSVQDRIEALSRKSDRMKEEDIWSLFLGVCKALKAMHTHSPAYAHRDVKPGNVMLGDTGEAVLMDLGSAVKARVEIKSRSEAIALQDEAAERCSMLFRPPELFNVEPGTSIDERTDIWSLGCTLYAMAFLESPFEQAYQRGDSIALAVMSDHIRIPQNTGYSSSIEETIRECMVVNPMERPFIDQILNKAQTVCNRNGANV